MKRSDIRFANIKDSEILAELAATTFWDTYHKNPNVNLKSIREYMASAFSVEKIEEELSDKNTIFLIAEKNETQFGYAKLILGSREKIISSKKPVEISRIYLRKEFLKRGFGSVLLEKCLDVAKANDGDSVWLSVWQFNQNAIRFYEKSGFEKIGTHTFHLASSRETDFIMEKKIEQISYVRKNRNI
ncbi:MAG: GNAT family N-acetyltransferase [Pyrinomonadaceae bacterium]|nr:GNAT family N-acetyltransferase [Pyrinomonadaceae bacterium]